jgi:hypothetical protein
MPEREDNLAQWLSELPKHLDTNTDERRQLYAGLKAYISRFPAYTTFSQLRRNEVEALSALVEKLCNAGEEREAA